MNNPGAGLRRTTLAPTDVYLAGNVTCRAWGFPGSRIDKSALETALTATVTDLPFLAGRLRGLDSGSLSGIYIEHTGDGALLTVAQGAQGLRLECMSLALWHQWGVTHEDVPPPFYIDRADTSMKSLPSEPLLKVRLTRLDDGDILALSINHGLADGMHINALVQHLAARYRQHAAGATQPDQDCLLCPVDRSWMCTTTLAAHLMGEEAGRAWQPLPLRVCVSLVHLWRLLRAAWSNTRQRCDIVALHIPESQVEKLKAAAGEGNPVAGVTRGDAVQAAVAMLQHAAVGRPLLPVAPWRMGVLLQLPAPPSFFGNCVYRADVSLPAGTAQPKAGGHTAALRLLAGAIREVVTEARSNPEVPLGFLHEYSLIAAAPLLVAFSWFFGRCMHRLSCTTNYIPQCKPARVDSRSHGQSHPRYLYLSPLRLPIDSTLDLGLGMPAAFHVSMISKRMRAMAVIRAAVAPEFAPANGCGGGSSGGRGGGLLVSLCLTPKQARRLLRHGVMAELLPEARLLGDASRYN